MSQDEIYQFLKKNKGKWYTARELMEFMNINLCSISINLRRLRHGSMINFRIKKEILSNKWVKEYSYKEEVGK